MKIIFYRLRFNYRKIIEGWCISNLIIESVKYTGEALKVKLNNNALSYQAIFYPSIAVIKLFSLALLDSNPYDLIFRNLLPEDESESNLSGDSSFR